MVRIHRRSLVARLRIEQLETRTPLAADFVGANVGPFTEPLLAAEVEVIPVVAEFAGTAQTAELRPIEPDTVIQQSQTQEGQVAQESAMEEPEASMAAAPELTTTDFLDPPGQIDVFARDEVLGNDVIRDELFDLDRLAQGIQNTGLQPAGNEVAAPKFDAVDLETLAEGDSDSLLQDERSESFGIEVGIGLFLDTEIQ